jgi:hypothetical protein
VFSRSDMGFFSQLSPVGSSQVCVRLLLVESKAGSMGGLPTLYPRLASMYEIRFFIGIFPVEFSRGGAANGDSNC